MDNYSFDLHIIYPDKTGYSCTLGRHTFDECLKLLKLLGCTDYRFARRESKTFGVRSGNQRMTDVCICNIYLPKNSFRNG